MVVLIITVGFALRIFLSPGQEFLLCGGLVQWKGETISDDKMLSFVQHEKEKVSL